MTQQSKTFVSAPQVRVLVSTDSGVLDLSDDVSQGQVRRVMNGVSQFSCILNNRNKKYIGAMKRMDRVVVWFKRISWIQVFAGYLDSVPGMGLYTNTVQIRASCTLKRLQNTYWDPDLPDSVALLDQYQYNTDTGNTYKDASGNTIAAINSDTGLGKMLSDILYKVGGWNPDTIKIQNIPSAFLDLGFKMANIEFSQAAVDNFRKSLGYTSTINDSNGNTLAGKTADNNTITILKTKPPTGSTYGMGDIVTILRAVGFKGDSLQVAAAIVMSESNGNPNLVTNVAHNENKVGLFQIDASADPVLYLSDAQLKDPLTNAGSAYSTITSNGTDFTYWASFNAKTYLVNMAQAKFYALQKDTGVVYSSSQSASSGSSGVSVADAQNASATKTESTNAAGATLAPGTTAIAIPSYDISASQSFMQNIYGNSQAAVEANLVNISFLGHAVKVSKFAADAFIKVSDQLTKLNSGYTIKDIGTYTYRTMNNGTKTSTLSWHSYGIAIDINSSTNSFVAAGIGSGGHDMPASWVKVFKDNNFAWGGDWSQPDFMHFQWQGGGTYVGNTGSVTTATGSIAGLTQNDVFQNGLFNYLYFGNPGSNTNLALQYVGDLAPVNDQQLLTTVQAVASSSLRSFMSGPNGDFIAFYPDRFGLNGTKVKFVLEDIELVDFSIDVNDDSMATDVFISGGTNTQIGNPNVDISTWLSTGGVVNIRQAAAMQLILGVDIATDPDFNPLSIYKRFGLRPLKAEYPQVSNHIMEYLQALSLFQQKWGEQYATQIQLTFMPELFPGMRIEVKSHSVVVFVEEVTHTFGYDTGFNTSATISSPASTVTGGIRGLPIATL